MKYLFRLSEMYAPTLKEVPAEAEVASHRLLLRSGMLRRTAAGIYSFLPLGFRALKKIEDIVREEMEEIGSQELLLPIVQPAELWEESGRWDLYGPELARLRDRHDRQFCLGPTHEEIITALVRGELKSYRQLPVSLFQINMKFRDEIRPRFGLLRGREFIMKDAYSFHASEESLQEHYDEQAKAYGRICKRLGLNYRAVEADSGQIGGKVTTEFMAIADAGEAEIVYCECGYAANTEVGEVHTKREPVSETPLELTRVATPDVTTIAELAAFLNVEEDRTVKALAAKTEDDKVIVFFVPGNRDLNEIKVAAIFGEVTMLDEDDFKKIGLHKGFIGPVGLPEEVMVVADTALRTDAAWTVGGNEEDVHFTGAALDRDFSVDFWYDLTVVQAGDICPKCSTALTLARGIEVSQVFQLGKRYSEAMNATYLDAEGKSHHFYMGCYGVGVSRSLAAVIEQHHDERGIKWPMSVAPCEVAVIPLAKSGDPVFEAAAEVARELAEIGIETAFDDRDERAGVKFADADLIGWPIQIVMGKKSFENGMCEIKIRASDERMEIALSEAVNFAVDYVHSQLTALGQ